MLHLEQKGYIKLFSSFWGELRKIWQLKGIIFNWTEVSCDYYTLLSYRKFCFYVEKNGSVRIEHNFFHDWKSNSCAKVTINVRLNEGKILKLNWNEETDGINICWTLYLFCFSSLFHFLISCIFVRSKT